MGVLALLSLPSLTAALPDEHATVSMERDGQARLCAARHPTGLGEGLAALLTQRFGEERMVALRFRRPTTSHLTEQWLAMSNSGRLKMDQADEAPPMSAEEA